MSSKAGVLVEVVIEWQRRQVLQEGRSVVCTHIIVIKSRHVGGVSGRPGMTCLYGDIKQNKTLLP